MARSFPPKTQLLCVVLTHINTVDCPKAATNTTVPAKWQKTESTPFKRLTLYNAALGVIWDQAKVSI